MATRSEDYYKEDDEDSYNYKKTILKMGKIDNFKYNYDVDYNDD